MYEDNLTSTSGGSSGIYESMRSGKKVKSLKKKYSSFFSNGRDIPEPEPELENSMEGIYPSLREFKDSQEVELVMPPP